MEELGNRFAKVTFYSGTNTVTGANFLLEDQTKILIDCGMVQGFNQDKENKKDFQYNPAEINYLLITHAHTDHIGRIGKLVKDGFNGTIYSTPQTKEISRYMLEDALKIMRYQKDDEDPLYEQGHVEKALNLWKTLNYHEEKELNEFVIFAKDAGHILGSAMYEITHKPSKRKIVFTGDLGNSPTPLLRDTEKITDADYLIMESVYGDRIHEDKMNRKEKLKNVLNKIINRKGTLIIPVFSLEKTQVLLHEMNDLIESGEVKSVPVFLDSPLGIKITQVYRGEKAVFNEHIQKEIKSGDDVFDFPKLDMTLRQSDSAEIESVKEPKIIISSSGMSEGGRITEHEKKYLPGNRNGFLLIGYQVVGSLGRKISDGNRKVQIDGEMVKVNAEIFKIDGYSSHKDSEGLLEFVADTAENVKKVFVVMGEPKSALYFVQKVRDLLEVDAISPQEWESFILK